MKIPAHLALFPNPSAASSADMQASRQPDRQAWQREMERAQMEDWLSHSLTASAGKATDMGSIEARGHHPAAGRLQCASTIVALRPATAAVQPVPVVGKVMATAVAPLTSVREAASVASQRTVVRIQLTTDANALSKVQKVILPAMTTWQPPAPPRTARPVPRLSLEWMNDDVRLWLGIGVGDGVTKGDLARLVSEVRSVLAADGVRIREVMCNGKPLDTFLLSTVQKHYAKGVGKNLSHGIAPGVVYPDLENQQEK